MDKKRLGRKATILNVNIESDKAKRLGYSKSMVSTSLMIGLDGLPLTTIWEDDYPVDVRLSQEANGQKNINTLGDQYVTSLVGFTGNPLRSFANFTPEWTEGTIVRRNGTRTLTIQVDNQTDRVASSILDEIRPQIDNLNWQKEQRLVMAATGRTTGNLHTDVICIGFKYRSYFLHHFVSV